MLDLSFSLKFPVNFFVLFRVVGRTDAVTDKGDSISASSQIKIKELLSTFLAILFNIKIDIILISNYVMSRLVLSSQHFWMS